MKTLTRNYNFDIFYLRNGSKRSIAGDRSSFVLRSNSILYTFQRPLPGTTYTGTVKATVKDLHDNVLQSNCIWTFTTSAIPIVTSTDPLI